MNVIYIVWNKILAPYVYNLNPSKVAFLIFKYIRLHSYDVKFQITEYLLRINKNKSNEWKTSTHHTVTNAYPMNCKNSNAKGLKIPYRCSDMFQGLKPKQITALCFPDDSK